MTVKLDRPIHSLKKIPGVGRPVHNIKCLFGHESKKHKKARKLKAKATRLGEQYLKAQKAERKAARRAEELALLEAGAASNVEVEACQ